MNITNKKTLSMLSFIFNCLKKNKCVPNFDYISSYCDCAKIFYVFGYKWKFHSFCYFLKKCSKTCFAQLWPPNPKAQSQWLIVEFYKEQWKFCKLLVHFKEWHSQYTIAGDSGDIPA